MLHIQLVTKFEQKWKGTLKEFKGIIDELNKFTHVEKETFDTDEDVAVQRRGRGPGDVRFLIAND